MSDSGGPSNQPTPGGWYPDPAGSNRLRYWDGNRWTDDWASPAGPSGPTPPPAPPPVSPSPVSHTPASTPPPPPPPPGPAAADVPSPGLVPVVALVSDAASLPLAGHAAAGGDV